MYIIKNVRKGTESKLVDEEFIEIRQEQKFKSDDAKNIKFKQQEIIKKLPNT